MKKYLRYITPMMILIAYATIAGGSMEEEDMVIVLSVLLGLILLFIIGIFVNKSIDRKKALNKAAEQFGHYTSAVEYDIEKFILYDETTNRLLLLNSIIDSTKIRKLNITRRDSQQTVTFKETQETKTSTGSVVGRSVAGALIAGPVGAIIGGSTAKQKQITKKVPDYHTVVGRYTIEVIDVDGISRGMLITTHEKNHMNTVSFLQNIIDKNTKSDRLALEAIEAEKQVKEAEKLMKLSKAPVDQLVVGINERDIQDILINSSIINEAGEDKYQLCSEAISSINEGWNTLFEKVVICIRSEIIYKIKGISRNFTASTFRNIELETSNLARFIVSQYGEPKLVAQNLSYTALTDDNNRMNAYFWENNNQRIKIDYICVKGNFKYEFHAEIE
jgi:hypothetical protein